MTTNIYLVRHGEIENPKNIIYERLPGFKLTQKGQEQLSKTASYLLSKNVKAIYTSPMLRTRQSARIIQSKLAISKLQALYDLIEVNTPLKGQPFEKLNLDIDYYSGLKPPYENMDKIAKRMERGIRKIAEKYKGETVVAISHGDPIMILKAKINNLPMKISSIRNTPYAKHGEVYLVQIRHDKKTSIESVFIP